MDHVPLIMPPDAPNYAFSNLQMDDGLGITREKLDAEHLVTCKWTMVSI